VSKELLNAAIVCAADTHSFFDTDLSPRHASIQPMSQQTADAARWHGCSAVALRLACTPDHSVNSQESRAKKFQWQK